MKIPQIKLFDLVKIELTKLAKKWEKWQTKLCGIQTTIMLCHITRQITQNDFIYLKKNNYLLKLSFQYTQNFYISMSIVIVVGNILMLIKTFACNGIIIIFLLYSNEMKWMRMHSLRNEAFVNITYIMNVLSAFNLHVWFNLWSILNNFSLDSFEQKNPLLFLHSSVFPLLFFVNVSGKKTKQSMNFVDSSANRRQHEKLNDWKVQASWLGSIHELVYRQLEYVVFFLYFIQLKAISFYVVNI